MQERFPRWVMAPCLDACLTSCTAILRWLYHFAFTLLQPSESYHVLSNEQPEEQSAERAVGECSNSDLGHLGRPLFYRLSLVVARSRSQAIGGTRRMIIPEPKILGGQTPQRIRVRPHVFA